MRIRLPLGRSLFFLCALLFSAVALAPLRLAAEWLSLDEAGLSAREAEGSIWRGSLGEARFGPVPLGRVQTQLRVLPLVFGRGRIDVSGSGEDGVEGSLTVSRHGFGVDDLHGPLQTRAVFAPLPIASVGLDDVAAHFANGACASAEGRVEAVIAGQVAGLALPGGLSGNARCDGGALLLPLVSQSGLETLDLRLFADGRYRAELALRPTDPAFAQRLAAAGLTPLPGGAYGMRVEGSF